ncbi:MAG: signal peptide peptidase SppA [Congregibacter sp.]
MIRTFFRGLWRAITVFRLALANILFIGLLVVLWLVLTDKPEPMPERAALLLNPTGQVVDARTRVDAASLLLQDDVSSSEVLLADLIDSVELARKDERIVALVLELDKLRSIGQSKTSELAAAIARFRATGKPIVAIGSYYTQDQYRLAIEADRLLMHPFGAVGLEGFSYFGNYLAEALEKLSVTVHVFRAGEFKSIAEPFMRSDMSPGEREVTSEWLGDLWRAYENAVEERRSLESGAVAELLGSYPLRLREQGGNAGRLALASGLVDELVNRDEQNEYLSELVGARDESGRYTAVTFDEYLPRVRQLQRTAGMPNIAVVTAQGNILPGEQAPGAIGGETLVRLLRETAERDDTRAIVLRINSGGGSVFASELIRAELERIRESGTPIVASMGSVAASGGYYIATAADQIVATPTTITGSIGVFAAFPTFERLLERGGIYTDGVGTTPVAGGLRPDRPLSPAVADALQQSVDDLYEQFLGLVMRSRNIDRSTMDQLAEGRVLSAEDALSAGLLDSLGGLEDAVGTAAQIAGLAEGEYETLSIQPTLSPRQQLLMQLTSTLGVDVAGLLNVTGLRAWVLPLRESVGLLGSFNGPHADPGYLYMRCLACAGP